MGAIQKTIEEYINLFASYPVNKNAEGKFLNYQLALAELCELLNRYDPASKSEAAPELTEDELAQVSGGYIPPSGNALKSIEEWSISKQEMENKPEVN